MARLVADLDASRAARAARGLHAELGKLGAEARVLDARFSQAEVGSQKYARATLHLQRALKRGIIDQKEHDRLLGIAKEKYGQAAIGAEQWGASLQRTGRQVSDLGGQLARLLTIPIAAVGAGSIKLATDFQSSFAGVRKTVNATEAEFAALSQGMRDLAQEIPVNVNELNKIGESAGQLGIQTDNILEFTETVAALGVTTNLTADQAATSFARIANITGLPQTKFDNLGSAVVALGNNFATTESEIVEFGLRIAGAGSIAGLTESQILGIGAAMSSVGVEAEAGGTSVQKVLLGMVQAVAQGNKDLAVFAKTAGMSGEEFAAAFKEDAGGAFAAFVAGLGKEGDKAFKTLEALNLTDQRLIRSFLSLANAGDLLERTMRTGTDAFKANTALAAEAEQRYKTFESQLTLFWNRLKDVGIELGTALLPVLRDTLDIAEPGIDIFAGMARGFGNLSTPLKVTTLGLLGFAAAAGPALFITGQLITAWGTLALSAPRLAGAIGLVASPIGLVTIALGALALAAYEAIDRWRRDSEEGIAAIIAANNRARESVRKLKEELSGGILTRATFEATIDESARLGIAIQATEARLVDLRSEWDRVGKAIATHDTAAKNLSDPRKLTASIEAEEEALANLRSELAVVDNALAQAAKSGLEFEETLEGAGGPPGGAEGLTKTAKALQEELKQLTKEIQLHEKAVQAAQQRISAAEQGYSEFASAIGKARRELGDLTEIQLAEWVEENLSVELTAEGWDTLAESIRNVEQALDELGQQNLPIEAPPLPAPVDNRELEFPDIIKEGNEDAERSAKEIRDTWVDIARIMADSIGEHNDGLADTINSLVQMVAMWEQLVQLSKQNASLAQSAAGGAAFGSAVGGFGQQLGVWRGDRGTSGFGGQRSGDYGDTGATVGGAIGAVVGSIIPGIGTAVGAAIGAVIGGVIGGAIKKGADEGLGELRLIGGEIALEITKSEGGLGSVVADVAKRIKGALVSILDMIDGELAFLGDLDIKIRDDDVIIFVNGLRQRFQEIDDAVNFAVLELLKTADIQGISPEVRAALENTVAETFDELEHDLNVAITSRDIKLGEFRASVRNDVESFFELFKEEIRLGIVEASGESGGLIGLVRYFTDAFDAFKGIEKDPAEAVRARAEALRAELELAKANLLVMRATLVAEQAELQASGAMAAGHANNARVITDAAMAAVLAQGAFAQSMVATAETAVTSSDAIALANAAALAAIDKAYAALDALSISDEDINRAIDAARRAARGGAVGTAKADRERVQDFLRDHELSQLSDLAEAHARLNLQRDELIRLAHGDAEAIAAVNAAIDQQIRLENQRAAGVVYSRIRDFERDPDISPFREGIRAVREEARSISEDFLQLAEDLDFGAERIERGLARIAAAEERRLQSLVEEEGQDLLLSMLDFLGRSEESERLQFALAQAELLIRYEELKIAVEKYGLELAVLDRIGELAGEIAGLDFEGWQRLRVATPTVNRFERATNSAADAAQRMADRLARAKESIGDFLASLGRGEQGGVSTMDGLAAARAQFDELLAQARAGNIQAIEAFPEVSRNLLELAREAFASSPEFQDIFAAVQAAGLELLGIQRVTQDNVIFDERFFTAQQQTTAATETGYARTTEAIRDGADRQVNATRDQTRALREDNALVVRRLESVESALNRTLSGMERRKGAA